MINLFWGVLVTCTIAQPRVWLSCPPSFDMSLDRSGSDIGPCEDIDPNTAFSQSVQAGDRLKVGWTSGNRGGGYAKLSLAQAGSPLTQESFDQNVLKVTCFGYDDRPNRFSFGSCNHPCNSRAGCEFQTDPADNQRYDTSITIPYNIRGKYILQLTAYVGISLNPVYSCAMLEVSGGDTSRKCTAPPAIPTPDNCQNVGSFTPAIIVDKLKPGAFCFGTDSASSVDSDLGKVPVNRNCDGRVSCDLSNVDSLCKQDITQSIASPTVSPHLPSCPVISTSSTTSTTAATSNATPTATSVVISSLPRPTTTSSAIAPTSAVVPPTSSSVASVPSPTDCQSPNPIIPSGTECDVPTAPIRCSGRQIAQCAYVVTSSGVKGNYVFTNCGAGTACKVTNGVAACDFDDGNCSPVNPVPPVVPPVSSTRVIPPPPITPTAQPNPTPSPIASPVTRSTLSPPPVPTIPANDAPCVVGFSLNTCSANGIAVCVYAATQTGYAGRYVAAPCPSGLVCSMGLGYPVCDLPGRSPTIDPKNPTCVRPVGPLPPFVPPVSGTSTPAANPPPQTNPAIVIPVPTIANPVVPVSPEETAEPVSPEVTEPVIEPTPDFQVDPPLGTTTTEVESNPTSEITTTEVVNSPPLETTTTEVVSNPPSDTTTTVAESNPPLGTTTTEVESNPPSATTTTEAQQSSTCDDDKSTTSAISSAPTNEVTSTAEEPVSSTSSTEEVLATTTTIDEQSTTEPISGEEASTTVEEPTATSNGATSTEDPATTEEPILTEKFTATTATDDTTPTEDTVVTSAEEVSSFPEEPT